MRNDVRVMLDDRQRPWPRAAAVAWVLVSAGACADGAKPASSDSTEGTVVGMTAPTTEVASSVTGAASTTGTQNTSGATSSLSATSGVGVTGATATTGLMGAATSATAAGGASATTSMGGAGGATSSSSLTTAGSGGVSSATATGTGGGGEPCAVAAHDPQNPPETLTLSGNLGTHDPVLIEADGVWYEFQTGPRILGKTSNDLIDWDGTPSALGAANPVWVAERVPGATDLWAPDISFFNDQYHLYYSASTFGSNTSCIGHATRPSLSSGSWSDQGPVVCSEDSDDHNAIDPNLIVDETGTPFLAFGSFWDGIKAIRLTAEGERADDELHSLASRGGGAIEAPFIVRRCSYYYLFVSFDSCCQGADSTYNIRVGRSENVLGPYVDQAGVALLNGGGTLLVSGDDNWKGPGHNAVIFVGNDAYNVYHAYAASNGAATLRISELVWDAEGWPISGGP